jgi:hypothetical protein
VTSTTEARTPLDELWHELLWQACASDGPIRDGDVKEAIRIYRPRIEREAAGTEALDAAPAVEALTYFIEARQAGDDLGAAHLLAVAALARLAASSSTPDTDHEHDWQTFTGPHIEGAAVICSGCGRLSTPDTDPTGHRHHEPLNGLFCSTPDTDR